MSKTYVNCSIDIGSEDTITDLKFHFGSKCVTEDSPQSVSVFGFPKKIKAWLDLNGYIDVDQDTYPELFEDGSVDLTVEEEEPDDLFDICVQSYGGENLHFYGVELLYGHEACGMVIDLPEGQSVEILVFEDSEGTLQIFRYDTCDIMECD